MCSLRNSLTVLAGLLLCCVAQAQLDTVATFNLDKSVITEERQKPIVVNSRGISGEINMDKIASIPTIMGTPDPLRFIRLLPSVQVNTEMEGGLFMQGGEHSHTLISQSGVPIYGAAHLLGFFSTFNSPHYSGMRYSTSCGQESRIGGVIDMQLADTVARKLTADLSIGLLSAQGTVDIPLGKSSLKVSARRSFINLIYGGMLKFEDSPIRYGFTDGNITWTWKPNRTDRITVDLFGSMDNTHFSTSVIESLYLNWYNVMGAVHWNHYFPGATLKQTVYGTTYGLKPQLRAFNIPASMDSYIADFGYRAKLSWNGFDFGARVSYYKAQPQNPKSEGHFNDANTHGQVPVQTGVMAALSAEYTRDLGYWLSVRAGAGVDWYLSPERRSYWGATPEVSLRGNFMEHGKVDFTYGIKRQHLFQTGLTSTGFPFEFWILAGDLQAPQWSHNFSLAYNNTFFNGNLAVSTELYYKQLFNQLEYVGNFIDLYNGDYSLETSTLGGHGRAFGANIMVQKTKGKLTGWISYAWSRSLRTFANDIHTIEYTSSHERAHELDVVVTYDFGKVDIGATFVASSGTPYTRPTSFYVVGSRIMCDYGPYNGERLPAYVKMDLSVNWYLNKGPKRTNGFNFAMYNVLGRNNSIGYGLHFSKDRTAMRFRPVSMQLRFLPSIGYFHKF